MATWGHVYAFVQDFAFAVVTVFIIFIRCEVQKRPLKRLPTEIVRLELLSTVRIL